jgi:hypothetical protein
MVAEAPRPREVQGMLKAATPVDLAVTLAGVLAELGVVQLVAIWAGVTAILRATKDDLVSSVLQMLEAGSGTLLANSPVIRFEVHGGEIIWVSMDERAIQKLRVLTRPEDLFGYE